MPLNTSYILHPNRLGGCYNVRITGRDTQANSIVEDVTLSDGTTVVAINGNAQPTLDIRAGTTAFGTSGITGGTIGFSGGAPNTNGNGTSADIAIGSITNRGGSVFLTNQYNPNTSLPGGAIQVGAINTGILASGNAGSVTIDSRGSIQLNDTLRTTVVSRGNGGEVTFKALNDITTGNIFTLVGAGGVGNGGNISLTSTAGAINTKAGSLDARTTSGKSGAIALQARNDTTTANLISYAQNGNAGNISLISTAGAIDTKAGTLYSYSGNGNAGAVTLNASDSITTGNINSYSLSNGNGGVVTLKAQNEINTSTGSISTIGYGIENTNGNGGIVTLEAFNDITTGNIFTLVGSGGIGNAGNISLTSTTGAINTIAGILDAGTTFGNGGTISLKAQSDITTADLRSYVVNNGRGNAGNISLTSTAGAIDTKAGTLYSNSNEGNGGDITFNANANITTGNIFSNGGEVTPLSLLLNRPILKKGNGGDITLNSNSNITTSSDSLIYSYGGISGGNITFVSNAGISLVNPYILSQTYDLDGSGKAGDINIQAKFVSLTGPRISSASFNQGIGGRLTVNASESVEVVGTLVDERSPFGLFTGTAGTGKAGDLTINTRRLTVEKGAVIGTFTLGFGEAGNLTVNASESVKLSGTSANAQTPSLLSSDTAGIKNAGDIKISTGRLIVQDGAGISVSTFGSGQGGQLIVNATESIELSGTSSNDFPSGLYAQSFSTGTAGDLTIYTGKLSLKDKARITVAAGNAVDINVPSGPLYLQEDIGFKIPPRSAGGKAGNLDISARTVRLDHQAKITGETTSGNGGNITMQNLDLLLMRHGSEISTTAGTAQQGGDGGNITINAPNGFIIAVPNENSDISANAFTGSGGRVQINVSGIYGIGFRDLENLLSSDITASSEFGADGTVELNTPEVDPNSGLVNLPTVPVDTEVAQGCYTPGYAQSSFVINGRGGLPPNPKDILTPDAPQIGWVSVKPSNNNPSLPPVTSKLTNSTPKRIVEATGATLNTKGQIVLSANSSTISTYSSIQNPVQCHGS
jgi:hypothetical protein